MSNLGVLLGRYANHPVVTQLGNILREQAPSLRMELSGLVGAQESIVMASMAQKGTATGNRLHLFIANGKEEAAYRYNDLQGLLGDERTLFFPDSFKRPSFFDDLNQTQILQRSEVVSHLLANGSNASDGGILITYPEALFEKVVRPEVLAKSRIDLKKGEKVHIDAILDVLAEYGFDRVDFVYEPGQFSLRGGIVDLFSFGNDLPYRIELFDDEVESIRTFDPLTQLSKQNLSLVSIVPNLNTRFKQEEKVSLLSVLPEHTVLWVKDFQFLLDRLQQCFDKAQQFAAKLNGLSNAELREIFRDRAFLYPGEVIEGAFPYPILFLEPQLDRLRQAFPDFFG